MARRNIKGRGKLSAIDMLPPEADEVIAWAAQELSDRNRTQLEIHAEFNARLADLGIGSVSKSAFNRHSMRLAELSRRAETTREITATMADRIDPSDEDSLTIIATHMVKTLVMELILNGGEAGFTPKQTLELASALKQATAASNISTLRDDKLKEQTTETVTEAIDKVAAVTGLSAERAAQIRKDVLGVAT